MQFYADGYQPYVVTPCHSNYHPLMTCIHWSYLIHMYYLLSTYRFSKGRTRDWRRHRTRCPWKIPSSFGEWRRMLIILVWRLKRGWKSFVWCFLPDSDAAESSEEELSLVRFSSCYWIRMVEYCPVIRLDWNGSIFCCYWTGLAGLGSSFAVTTWLYMIRLTSLTNLLFQT